MFGVARRSGGLTARIATVNRTVNRHRILHQSTSSSFVKGQDDLSILRQDPSLLLRRRYSTVFAYPQQNVLIRFEASPSYHGASLFHTTVNLNEKDDSKLPEVEKPASGDQKPSATKKPSSKIEMTVNRIKEKQEAKLNELLKQAVEAQELVDGVDKIVKDEAVKAEVNQPQTESPVSASPPLPEPTATKTLSRKEAEVIQKTPPSTPVEVTSGNTSSTSNTEVAETSKVPPKKSLWVRFVDEVKHYYSGFKLLYLDVKVSSKIVWKVSQGKELSRRENKQLVRTVGDLFRLVPFSVFIIVPFMELLLPVALKLFPGMLPTTFTTKSERETKMRRTLKAKLEYAKFLQKTLDEMAPVNKESRSSRSAKDFANFYKRVKEQGVAVRNEDIVKFSKLFEDEITLDTLERSQLIALCKLLELTPMGTNNFLRLQLEMKVRQLKTDDRVIRREGIDNLDVIELQNANKERGMRAIGLSTQVLRQQLGEWLELSLDQNIPPSLLLLSRTLYLPQNLDAKERIAATISSLPESAASRTTANIGEREGKVRNVVQLEIIKEEQKKIEEEEAETQRLQEKADQLKAAEESKKEEEFQEEAPMVDKAQELEPPEVVKEEQKVRPVSSRRAVPTVDSIVNEALRGARDSLVESSDESFRKRFEAALNESVSQEEKIQILLDSLKKSEKALQAVSSEELSTLKKAIESLGKAEDEVEEIGHLKKELDDYKEDLDELQFLKAAAKIDTLNESKGARRLFSKVNRMLGKVESRVMHLKEKEEILKEEEEGAIDGEKAKKEEKKKVVVETVEKQLKEIKAEDPDVVVVVKDDENLVTISDLIAAVQKIQDTPDSSKLEKIADVLEQLDADSDGIINVNLVMRVIELIGREQINLNPKQIKKIIDMLEKEEMLEVESNIEDSLGLTAPDPEEDNEVKSKLEDLNGDEEVKTLSRKNMTTAEVDLTERLGKNVMQDKAKDISEETEQHLKEMFERQPSPDRESETSSTSSPDDSAKAQQKEAMKCSPENGTNGQTKSL